MAVNPDHMMNQATTVYLSKNCAGENPSYSVASSTVEQEINQDQVKLSVWTEPELINSLKTKTLPLPKEDEKTIALTERS